MHSYACCSLLLLLLLVHTQQEECDLLQQRCHNAIGEQCEYCLPGSFPNQSTCDPCAPGTFQASYTPVQQTWRECEPCPPGHYASQRGATACAFCDEGTFASEAGSSQCKQCPAGSDSLMDDCSCRNGLLSLRQDGILLECLPCDPTATYMPGYLSASGCQRCTPRSDSKQFAAPPCTAQADAVWHNCTICQERTVTVCTKTADALCLRACRADTEVWTIDRCECVEGHYRLPGTEVYGFVERQPLLGGRCQACGPGTYLSGASQCVPCTGPREFTSSEGQVGCALCAEGEFATPNHTACASQCVENHVLQWNASSSEQHCVPCPEWTVASEDGLVCGLLPEAEWPTVPCLVVSS